MNIDKEEGKRTEKKRLIHFHHTYLVWIEKGREYQSCFIKKKKKKKVPSILYEILVVSLL